MDRRLALAAAALALVPAAASASSGGGEKKKGGGLTYLQIKSVMASVMRRDGRRGVMTVECGCDIHDDKLRATAEASIPRLRSGYASFIQAYALGLPSGGCPNADYISREMQRITDEVLHKKGAKLLLGTILIN
jgi:hypothetical protein